MSKPLHSPTPEEAMADAFADGDISSAPTPSSSIPEFEAVDVANFLALEIPPRRNIMEPWLPAQGLAMIYAPAGVGKTFFALEIACACVCGTAFLGWEVAEPVGVLYVDGEMPAAMLQERLARIFKATGEAPQAPLSILTPDLLDNTPNLANQLDRLAISKTAAKAGSEVIVIDNLSCLLRGAKGENEAESWIAAQEWALQQRREGRTILFVHHAGKGGDQRGTSKRIDVLDTAIKLSRPENAAQGCNFKIEFTKGRGLHGEALKSFEAEMQTTEGGREWLVSRDLRRRVVDLKAEGQNIRQIAAILGISKSAVGRMLQKEESA